MRSFIFSFVQACQPFLRLFKLFKSYKIVSDNKNDDNKIPFVYHFPTHPGYNKE